MTQPLRTPQGRHGGQGRESMRRRIGRRRPTRRVASRPIARRAARIRHCARQSRRFKAPPPPEHRPQRAHVRKKPHDIAKPASPQHDPLAGKATPARQGSGARLCGEKRSHAFPFNGKHPRCADRFIRGSRPRAQNAFESIKGAPGVPAGAPNPFLSFPHARPQPALAPGLVSGLIGWPWQNKTEINCLRGGGAAEANRSTNLNCNKNTLI